MPTRREMMVATAAAALGLAGCTSDETGDTTMSEKDTDPFEIETMSEDASMDKDNGLSELARVYDPDSGVLIYAAVSMDTGRSLEVESFAPDEHDYEG